MLAATAVIKVTLSCIFLIADLFVIAGIVKTSALSAHPIMILNGGLFLTEIFKICAQITSEYPMEIMGRVIWDCPISDIWAIWSLIPWFASIYLYPLLALLHIFAIYRPVLFKTLKHRTRLAYTLVALVVGVSIIMALAYVIPSCGIFYSQQTLYWEFRFDRPQVRYMENFNYILTIFSIATTILFDVAIIARMASYRNKKKSLLIAAIATTPPSASQNDFSRPDGMTLQRLDIMKAPKKSSILMTHKAEMRLALNFFCVFFIFAWEFFAFNVVAHASWGYFTTVILFLTSIISNAKGTCYLFFSKNVRTAVIGLLR